MYILIDPPSAQESWVCVWYLVNRRQTQKNERFQVQICCFLSCVVTHVRQPRKNSRFVNLEIVWECV